MKHEDLVKYLPAIGDGSMLTDDSPDVSMVPVGHGMHMISSTDFFSPITQDPYKQGRIAAANTLSDVYALGVDRIDNMLMILGVCRKMTPPQREIVTRRMIEGFNDACKEAETKVTGGQTVLNPWPILGGVAMSVVTDNDMVRANQACPGDVVVLTKPLGSQITANLSTWMLDQLRWSKASQLIDAATAERAVLLGEAGMMRLNRGAATAMREVGAHGATDVTGFGLLGHADNLAQVQCYADPSKPLGEDEEAKGQRLDIVIHTLPIIRGLLPLDGGAVTADFGLLRGFSAETSGGLLVLLPPDAVVGFQQRLLELDGADATSWVVGEVVVGTGVARFADGGPAVVEV